MQVTPLAGDIKAGAKPSSLAEATVDAEFSTPDIPCILALIDSRHHTFGLLSAIHLSPASKERCSLQVTLPADAVEFIANPLSLADAMKGSCGIASVLHL